VLEVLRQATVSTFITAIPEEVRCKEPNLFSTQADMRVIVSWNVNSWTRYSWGNQGEEYVTHVCTTS
jgi:hypothetical protein